MLLIGGKLVNFRNLLPSFVLYFCKDTKKNETKFHFFVDLLICLFESVIAGLTRNPLARRSRVKRGMTIKTTNNQITKLNNSTIQQFNNSTTKQLNNSTTKGVVPGLRRTLRVSRLRPRTTGRRPRTLRRMGTA